MKAQFKNMVSAKFNDLETERLNRIAADIELPEGQEPTFRAFMNELLTRYEAMQDQLTEKPAPVVQAEPEPVPQPAPVVITGTTIEFTRADYYFIDAMIRPLAEKMHQEISREDYIKSMIRGLYKHGHIWASRTFSNAEITRLTKQLDVLGHE